eukprot:COSAG06_NODE_1360_length_9719_cov_7.643867_3_plen_54_part_00
MSAWITRQCSGCSMCARTQRSGALSVLSTYIVARYSQLVKLDRLRRQTYDKSS